MYLFRYSKHYTHPLEKSEIVRVAKDSCKSMEFQRVKVITHGGPLSPGGASTCYYKNLEGFPNQVQWSLIKSSLLAFLGKKSIHLPGWQINDQQTTLLCFVSSFYNRYIRTPLLRKNVITTTE